MDAVTIRLLTVSDLDEVARIHLRAFPDSALTALGAEAVRRYYAWQLRGPHEALALGAAGPHGLVGFCFGGVFRGALSGFLRANRAYLVTRVLTRPWLLGNPLFRDRVASSIRILAKRIGQGGPPTTGGSTRGPSSGVAGLLPHSQASFGILAIAVDPAAGRGGYGSRLMAEMESAARARHFHEMRLTVHPDNEVAVRFYERLDWLRAPSAGRWQGLMIRHLTTDE